MIIKHLAECEQALYRLLVAINTNPNSVKQDDLAAALGIVDNFLHELIPFIGSVRDQAHVHYNKHAALVALDRAIAQFKTTSSKRQTSFDEAMKVLDAPDRKWTRSGIR